MKKLFFIVLFFVSLTNNAQDLFIRNYNSFINTKNGIKEEEKEVSVVVVFNADGEKKVVFKFATGNVFTLYQIGKLENGKTDGGYEYQGIEVINQKNGEEFYLQLFDKDNVLRLIFDEDNNIEFYK
jgi:hypothetical protein